MEDITTSDDATRDAKLQQAIADGRQRVHDDIMSRHRQLGELEAALAQQIGAISTELARSRKANLDTEAELLENRAAMEAATKKLRLEERGLAQLRRECEANSEELAYHRQRLQQKLAELEIEKESLDQARLELKKQRQQIADQLKAERKRNQRELAE